MPESKFKKEELELLGSFLDKLNSQQLLKLLLQKIQSEQDLKLNDLVNIFQEVRKQPTIPLSIFSSTLKPAEALCKYLRENEKLSYQEIAKLINRNEKSVWASYQRAKKKKKQMFLKTEEKYLLPISILQNRSYSLLENILLYLYKTYKLTNPQIAKLLKKSPNSIAVLMKRAREKGIGEKEAREKGAMGKKIRERKSRNKKAPKKHDLRP